MLPGRGVGRGVQAALGCPTQAGQPAHRHLPSPSAVATHPVTPQGRSRCPQGDSERGELGQSRATGGCRAAPAPPCPPYLPGAAVLHVPWHLARSDKNRSEKETSGRRALPCSHGTGVRLPRGKHSPGCPAVAPATTQRVTAASGAPAASWRHGARRRREEPREAAGRVLTHR